MPKIFLMLTTCPAWPLTRGYGLWQQTPRLARAPTPKTVLSVLTLLRFVNDMAHLMRPQLTCFLALPIVICGTMFSYMAFQMR